MIKSEAIMVRVGEQSLKSDFVRKRFQRILVHNIQTGLDSEKIKYKIKPEKNRIIIETKQTQRAVKILKRIFGITSISPVWISKSSIKDMRKAGLEIAQLTKLSSKESFAVRARRSGIHDFTSRDIGREVGDEINNSTGAGVNLTNPDREFFIDCRQKESYFYVDSIRGTGGIPLGASGPIFAYVDDDSSVLSAWMIMRRGCRLYVFAKSKKYFDFLEKWHIGKKLKAFRIMDVSKINAIAVGENTNKKMLDILYECKTLVLRPLIGLDKKAIKDYYKKIGLN